MKTCSKCRVEKSLSEFTKRKDCKDGYAGQCKSCHKANIYAWRKCNKDKVNATKRKYYSSEKGKECKKREALAYIASGKRALTDKRRALKPLSEARKQSRLRYNLKKRTANEGMSELDTFVLSEAVSLCRGRYKLTGIKWHVDHIKPVSKGGKTSWDNLQVVPARWNQQKSNKHEQLFFTKKG